jgi:hypothetical protein
MNVSYGSPGHRGVTHLMAVGDDGVVTVAAPAQATGGPFAPLTAQRVYRAAIAATVVGLVFGMPRVTAFGAGAGLAMFFAGQRGL